MRRDVDRIVTKILEITRYVDTVDLKNLLSTDIIEDHNTAIYQEEIIDIYKNFDIYLMYIK